MIVECCACKKVLRRTPDEPRDAVSHTFCPPCAEALNKKLDEEVARRKALGLGARGGRDV